MVGPQTHLVARYLDLLSLDQRVTASNIANVDTPGYRTRGFNFQSELQQAMTDPRNPSPAAPAVHEIGGLPVKNDGNDVQLERELRTLGENGIRFSHALLMLRNGMRAVRSAIHEGRGG